MGREETERRTGGSAGPQQQGEAAESRQGGMRAVGGTASRIAAPIVRRHGGGTAARLKAEWSAVVGAQLAARTWPESVGRDGALKLRVVAGFALELQHRAPVIIERINLFFGRDAVSRLVLVQGPLPIAFSGPSEPPRAASGEQVRALEARLTDIGDRDLREALAVLGRLVLAGKDAK